MILKLLKLIVLTSLNVSVNKNRIRKSSHCKVEKKENHMLFGMEQIGVQLVILQES